MLLIDEVLYNPVAAAPRNWEHAVGYDGGAKYVAFYWDPIGDEAVWDDGCASADGNWRVYLEAVDNLPLNDEQQRSLGSSDGPASHCLLLDRETRNLYLLPRWEAAPLLRKQHPPAPVLSPEEADAAFRSLLEGWEEEQKNWQEELARGGFPCKVCGMGGWIRAGDGGYDPCPACGGRGFIPAGNTEQ